MTSIGPDYIQIVEIVGTQKFEEFVRGLEVEGVGLGLTKEPPPLGVHIYPMKVKDKYDTAIPILTPTHTREFKGLSDQILNSLPTNPRGLSVTEGTVSKVQLVESVTQQVVAQKQVTISTGLPEANEILTHLTNRICKEAHIDGQFATIYPIIKRYVRYIFFGQEVDLDHTIIRRLLCDTRNAQEIISTLAKTIGKETITKIISTLNPEPLHLLELDGFYWRRDWIECNRTVFNITPCYNNFEKHFAQFLDKAEDIDKFAKLAEEYTKFKIEYLNHKGAISYYYPDFVAEQQLTDGSSKMWLIETKGWEQPDVPLKDARATEWCSDATRLTGVPWQYLKISYTDYVALTNNLSQMPSYRFETLKTQLEARSSGAKMDL
jgi:type III restriction enzyme